MKIQFEVYGKKNRDFKIEQHLSRYFVYYDEYLSNPSHLSIEPNHYPFSQFNDIHQS